MNNEVTPKTYIGVYDCEHCGKENEAWILDTEGKPIKVLKCMGCGAPIPEGEGVFKLPPNPKTIEEKWMHLVGGPDFICSNCGSTIPDNDEIRNCPSCGHPKESSDKQREKRVVTVEEVSTPEKKNTYNDCFTQNDLVKEGYTDDIDSYFEDDKKEERIMDTIYRDYRPKKEIKVNKKKFFYLGIGLVVVLFAWLIWFFFIADVEKEAALQDKTWSRSINIQSYEWVTEQDWEIPPSGKYVSQEQKHHHYESKYVKTVKKTRPISEHIPDGIETYKTGNMEDNANGTFTEETATRTKYKTVNRQEEYDEDIYEDVSIEQTYYTYRIQRWVHNRTRNTSGSVRSNYKPVPYWYKIKLAGNNERVGSKSESYILLFYYVDMKGKTEKFDKSLTQTEWKKYSINQKFVLVTNRVGMVKDFYPKP